MTDDVARYYDENTRRFLSEGQGGRAGVIHRAVWGEGVTSRDEAFHFVHELVLREIEAVEAATILDLGCGVGASLAFILGRSGARGSGVTNSELQAKLAPAALDVLHGSFETAALPSGVGLAYAIESFVHASRPERFFENVAPALVPGGRLVLCDDFLVPSEPGRDSPWVRDFAAGWHAPSLATPGEVDEAASARGLVLVSDRDLTGGLEIDRPRDHAIRAVVAAGRLLGGRGARFDALSGGNALRQCLKRGLVTYRFRVYERRPR